MHFEQNLALVDQVKAVALAKGVTPAQLALAWALGQGPDVVPIPGTKRRVTLEENVAAVGVVLSPQEVARLEAALPKGAAAGTRYPAANMKMLGL